MKTTLLKSAFLEVELILPLSMECGARFNRGGWIRNVRCLKSGHAYFVEEADVPGASVCGCPHEFLTPLDLKGSGEDSVEQMKIGVGRILHRSGETRFSDRLLKPYLWQTSSGICSDMDGVCFEQRAKEPEGYGYMLKQAVFVQENVIQVENTLENLGVHHLETDVYIHPFFDERSQNEGFWFHLPGLNESTGKTLGISSARSVLGQFPAGLTSIAGSQLDSSANWVSTGSRTCGYAMTIESETPFSKINLWRSPGLCFAIEPYIPISLEPGETRDWSWYLRSGYSGQN